MLSEQKVGVQGLPCLRLPGGWPAWATSGTPFPLCHMASQGRRYADPHCSVRHPGRCRALCVLSSVMVSFVRAFLGRLRLGPCALGSGPAPSHLAAFSVLICPLPPSVDLLGLPPSSHEEGSCVVRGQLPPPAEGGNHDRIRALGGERPRSTTTSRGRGFVGRTRVSGKRPTGAASFRPQPSLWRHA